ncbi:MAG: D-alanyl-D-alanine carboxypeptidase [Deltaproteobacteria bacterium]|nr:D-alanyl-D-alanine carboxypeptidase [Deltaproteobacteria bacterium]
MHLTTQSHPPAQRTSLLALAALSGLLVLAGPATPADAKGQTDIAAPRRNAKAKGGPIANKAGKTGGRKGCKSGKKKRKNAGRKRGRKRVQLPPRHRHSERRVAAMKGNLPNVQSRGALVVDLDTGEELFARKPDVPRSIASISKLAAVLVVMDRSPDLEGLTTIKKVDAEVARGGAKSRLLEGLILSNRDLLHASLLGSDNRAISALGRAVGLNVSQLTTAMNRKVASLGLRHTRFREPTGLSGDNQSTPRETIALLRAAMAHPVLGPILQRIEYDAHPVSKPAIRYVNTHRPAARANVQVLGGKTGYNDAARYCLVIVAKISGRNCGMALLGTEGDRTRFGDVARVADWIVTHKPKRAPAAKPQGPPSPETILAPPSPDAAIQGDS